MKRIRLVGVCLVVAFAVIPATAQAFVPFWEVKAPPVGWALLPEGTPVKVSTSGSFSVTGEMGAAAFKNVCGVADTERIENPVGGAEGEDEMLEFAVSCSPNGNAPFPCAAGEAYTFKGALSAGLAVWHSELEFPSNDVFETVTLKVECASTATLLYHPPGHTWNPKISVNALKVSAASGTFRHGIHHFVFVGTDSLKAAGYGFVR
jgi:hypothetical protein